MLNFKIYSEEDARSMIDMKTAIRLVKAAYQALSEGRMRIGKRIVQSVGPNQRNGQWLTAVCYDPPYFGTKFSADFPDNHTRGLPSVRSVTELYSSVDGSLLALIEANWLTAVKTGSAAAVATDLLSRKDASRLGIIGTGVQAFTQVTGIQEVRRLSTLNIFDTSRERMEIFADRISKEQNAPYEIVLHSSADSCVSASEIICTATPSRTPVFHAAALRPGTHVNAIGSFTPQMQEIESDAVKAASCIVTEHTEGLWAAAGDILIPLERGEITRDCVSGNVADVLTGKIPGRISDDEITLYESVGSAVLDLAMAIGIYES